MKKLFAICILFIFTLTGCAIVNLNAEDVLFGKGEIKSHELNIGEFDSVQINGDFEIVYRYGASTSVVAEMQDNLFENLFAHVNDYNSETEKISVLSIYSYCHLRTSGNKYPKIIITAPQLKDFYIQGSAVMKDSDPIIANIINIVIEGTSDIDINVETEYLGIDVSGVGNAKISGTANNTLFNISGTGNINALDHQTKTATVYMSGTGNASIYSTDSLDINVSGTGSLKYKGNPEITQEISGMGSVKKVD